MASTFVSENPLFEEYYVPHLMFLSQINIWFLLLSMYVYAVWIKNYGGHLGFMQVTKFPQGFHSGNQAKFVLQIHVITKP